MQSINQRKSTILKQKSGIALFYYKIWFYSNKHINYKMGMVSGLVMGTVVFFINADYGFLPALGGFLKQFFFNLFMAGYNTRTCEKLAKSIKNSVVGMLAASVIPTVQAFLILFSIHYFGGTPKPMASTIWQAVANLFFFFGMALIYRNIILIKNASFYKIAKVFRLRIRLRARIIYDIGKHKKLRD